MISEPDSGPAPAAQATKGLRFGTGAVASLVGLAALVIFMVQNTDSVRVTFLAWDFTMSVWLLVLLSAVAGAVVWIGAGVLRRHRRRRERREARRD